MTDAGAGYLKARGNVGGEHCLACEWVATHLARWFELPTFDFALLELTDLDEIPLYSGRHAEPGPAFVTRAESGEPWGGKDIQLNRLINPLDISRLVVLDTWILNCDRFAPNRKRINYNNVFLSGEAPDGYLMLKAMDHTHAFTCGRDLSPRLATIDRIRDTSVFGLFPEFIPRLSQDAFNKALDDLAHLPRQFVEGIVGSVPPEWDVSKAASEALTEFIVQRARFLADRRNGIIGDTPVSGESRPPRGKGGWAMKPTRGYYCIIQFCPDLGRLEAANIGVLLFCPDLGFLKTRTSSNNARIRRLFDVESHDWARINSFKLGIEERLDVERENIRTLDALETFIARRANLIQISSPRPMKVTEPEKDLDQLFKDLVGGQARINQGPSLKRFLRQKFSTAGLDQKIQTDIRVKIPISERQIEVPYGFRNRRYNLIQVVRFQATNPEHAKTTACRYAVEGESLYEIPDPHLGQLQLILVGEFGSKLSESRSGVERILEAHHVRLFPATEVDRLVEEIKRTAKDLPGAVAS